MPAHARVEGVAWWLLTLARAFLFCPRCACHCPCLLDAVLALRRLCRLGVSTLCLPCLLRRCALVASGPFALEAYQRPLVEKSLTQLATFMADYTLYTIQIAKGYGMNEWRENLKECLLMAGVQDKPGELCRRRICVSVSPTTNRVKTNLTLTRTHAHAPPKVVFMFDDTQIIMESMTEDINAILNSGDVPNLYAVEDLEEIASACNEDCVRKRIPQTKLNLFSCYLTRVRRNM